MMRRAILTASNPASPYTLPATHLNIAVTGLAGNLTVNAPAAGPAGDAYRVSLLVTATGATRTITPATGGSNFTIVGSGTSFDVASGATAAFDLLWDGTRWLWLAPAASGGGGGSSAGDWAYVEDTSVGAGETYTTEAKKWNEITLTGAGATVTITEPDTNSKVWETYLKVKQDGSGARTITTWNNVDAWFGTATKTTAPVLTPTASEWDMFKFLSRRDGSGNIFTEGYHLGSSD